MATSIATAYVDVNVNTEKVNKELEKTRANVQNTMKSFVRFGNDVSRVLRNTMIAGIGAATLSFDRLLRSSSAAGAAARKSWGDARGKLDESLARIGGMILQSNIFGKTIVGWVNALASFLNKLKQADIQRFISGLQKVAILWGAIKFGTIAIKLSSDVMRLMESLRRMQRLDVATGAGGALGAGIAANAGATSAIAASGAGVLGSYLAGLKQMKPIMNPQNIQYGAQAGMNYSAWGKSLGYATQTQNVANAARAANMANIMGGIGASAVASSAAQTATKTGVRLLLGNIFRTSAIFAPLAVAAFGPEIWQFGKTLGRMLSSGMSYDEAKKSLEYAKEMAPEENNFGKAQRDIFKKYGYNPDIKPDERGIRRDLLKDEADVRKEMEKDILKITKERQKEMDTFNKPSEYRMDYIQPMQASAYLAQAQKENIKKQEEYDKKMVEIAEEEKNIMKEHNDKLGKIAENTAKLNDLLRVLTPKDAIDVLESVGGY